jgi:hypothetical protein
MISFHIRSGKKIGNDSLDDLQRWERFTSWLSLLSYVPVSTYIRIIPWNSLEEKPYVYFYVDMTKRMTDPRPTGQISGYLGACTNGESMRCSRWSSRNKCEASQGGYHLSSRNIRWR